MIPAHDSPVAAMAFNSAGTKLSTASEKASQKINTMFKMCFSREYPYSPTEGFFWFEPPTPLEIPA